MIAPAMPVVMQHDRTFFAPARAGGEFRVPLSALLLDHADRRAAAQESFAEGFLEMAMAQNPKPQTLAMIGADAEFPRNAMEGVRSIAQEVQSQVVYDKTYPPTTADYTPVVRAVAATNPDIFLACPIRPIRWA